MYLTSMLLRNSAHNWQGTNVLLYEEPVELGSLEVSSTTRQLLGLIEARIGAAKTLRAAKIAVPGGGHGVEAYLDILVGGSLSIEAFTRIAERTRQELENPSVAEKIAWSDSSALVSAYVRRDLDLVATFEILRAAAGSLLDNPQLEQYPLRIRELRRESGSVFELEQESIERLRALHGSDWIAPKLHLSDDIRDDLQQMHGNFNEQLVPLMTGGIDEIYLVRLGGVVLVDAEGGVRRLR